MSRINFSVSSVTLSIKKYEKKFEHLNARARSTEIIFEFSALLINQNLMWYSNELWVYILYKPAYDILYLLHR